MRLRFAFLSAFFCLVSLTAPAAHSAPPRLDSYGDPLPQGALFRIGTTRLRTASDHKPAFTHLLFTPDGKSLISGAGGETEIRQWEIATGREVRPFPAHLWGEGPTFCLSPDGSRLAVSTGWQLELYAADTGKKERRTINVGPEHMSQRRALAWSPDGKSLALRHWNENGGGNQTGNGILRWEAATGKNIGTWKMGEEAPLALSADGRFVASMRPNDPRITLWDAAASKKLREWKGEKIAPLYDRCLTFSPDGQYLVLAGTNGMIHVYETATGKELRSWKGRSPHSHPAAERIVYPRAVVGWLTFAPDGKVLASVEDDRNVLTLWDPKTGRALRDFEGVDGPVAFSSDGKMLAAGGADSRIRLWDAASGRELCPLPDPGPVTGVNFSPDGRSLAAASKGPHQVRLLDAASGRLIQRYSEYRSLSFAPDGQSYLVQRRDESYALVDAATGKDRFPIVGAPLGWVPKSNLLMVRDHSTFRVWDTASGKKVQEFGISTKKNPLIMALKKTSGITHSDMSFAYSESRRVAVMERNAPLVRVFSLETGKELGQLEGISQDLMYQAQRQSQNRGQGMGGTTPLLPDLSPDGETLVVGINQNSFGLRDVATGKWSVRFRCDAFLPHQPTFSPSGDLLSLLDTRGDPCLVEAATGRMRHRLTWKEGDLFWILSSVNREFAPDGRLLAVAYDADALVLWETATGRQIRTWPGHGRGRLRQMAFSSDGRRLATVSMDGTALVWDVTGMSPDGQLPARKLTPAEVKQAWSDLADVDAAKGHRAIWTLVADPAQALPLLREQLHPARGGDPRRIAQLIADLDSDDFSVRDMATQELKKMGEVAQPALQAALKDKPALELRRRAQGLLDEMDSANPTAESLRVLRAVAVLEYLASAEARQLLGTLADGAPEARLTREAKAGLVRLRLRNTQP